MGNPSLSTLDSSSINCNDIDNDSAFSSNDSSSETSDDYWDFKAKSNITLELEIKREKHKTKHVETPLRHNLTTDFEIDGILADTLIDSGSTLNFINDEFFDKLLDVNGYACSVPANLTVTIADKSLMKSKRSVTVELVIEGEALKFRMYVLKNIGHDCILGTSFMRRFNAHIKFDTSDEQITTDVIVNRKLTIPPMSVLETVGEVNTHADLHGVTGILENSGNSKPFLLQHIMVKPGGYKNEVKVVLANITNVPIRIERFERVAIFNPAEDLYKIPLDANMVILKIQERKV